MDRLGTFASVIEQGIDAGLHIGAQVSAVVDGQVVVDRAFGTAGSDVAMTEQPLALWLSAGKPVTAIAIMQCVDAGLLSLDDPVATHLPQFAAHGKERITIRHLLTHTAGLRLERFDETSDDWSQIIDAMCRARPEPRWQAGEKAGYHRAGTWYLLAEIVRSATGERFDRYVRQRLFEPMGMVDCWIGMPGDRIDQYTIAPMPTTNPGDVETGSPWTTSGQLARCKPASGLVGPANQIVRLYQMLLGGGQIDGQRMLSDQSVHAMTSRQRQGMKDHTFQAYVDWGLGLILDSKRYGRRRVPYGYGPRASDDTFGHGGNQSSVAFADPQHGLAAAIVFIGRPGERAHQQRLDDTLEALYADVIGQ